MFFNLIKESFLFAINSLVTNKLRTFLSLLGITIGIFAIISVFTVIDSLERSIKNSIQSLGDNVVFVQKWPWTFGPDYPWWKYVNRPVPTIKEQEEVENRSNKSTATAFLISTQKTVQFKNSSASEVNILGASHNYEKVRSFEIINGRYFSDFESNSGKNCAIIGFDISNDLFEQENPIGKEIKLMGRKVNIIGVFKREGEDMFENSLDRTILIPINFTRNLIDIRNDMLQPMIMIKAKTGVSVDELSDELRGIMRSIRRIKPLADDDFALNQTSMISTGFQQIFAIIDIAGLLIGGFSILVGGFGIANIMFVSVKERTGIIGIQKALGAKKYFILLQFLYESVILSLIGGIIGLILIYIGTLIANFLSEDMQFAMSFGNIAWGIGISVVIGILSGFSPAYSASKLNPVEAISTMV